MRGLGAYVRRPLPVANIAHFNIAPPEQQSPRQNGPMILNGDRYYSYDAAIAAAKRLGSVVVQFVERSGRMQSSRPCMDDAAVAAAIPTDFRGGYVTMRANPAHLHVPRAKRDPWDR